jgi:2,4-didehydro-3-deoxy-L-rhamnonate hydrolase
MGDFFVASVEDGDGATSAVVRDGAVYIVPGRPSVGDLLRDWDAQVKRLGEDLDGGRLQEPVALEAVKLLTPVADPPNLYLVGGNYADHAREMQKLGPDVPVPRAVEGPFVFLKPKLALSGPGDPIIMPPGYERLDWEAELAVVIGRRGYKIPAADVRSYVAGYTVANDVSVRDAFRRSSDLDPPLRWDWFLHKGWAGSCPVGPWLVPASSSFDPDNAPLRLSVNGEFMQDSNTSQMLFSADEIVAFISNVVPLLPGDIIATGTCAGVGMGRGIFLKEGDDVVAEVGGVGELRNDVVGEAQASRLPALAN